MVEKLATNSQAWDQDAAPPGAIQLVDGDAADGREVAGDERQDAGRQERDQARAERRQDADARCWIAFHRPER